MREQHKPVGNTVDLASHRQSALLLQFDVHGVFFHY